MDLCGGTGAWSEPYKVAGYDVRLITLPEDDVRLYQPPAKVYGILAAPPCTEFALSGARWWKDKDAKLLLNGLEVVDACIRIIETCQPKFWALENPIGRLRRLRRVDLFRTVSIGEPNLIFNPCDYGDAYTKKTMLWGTFRIPAKNPVEPVFVIYKKKRYAPNYGGSTNKFRSVTPAGFAKAFFEANR